MRESTKPAEPSDGKTEALPEQRTTLALDRTYTERQMSLIRRGFIPREMQDKWFVYSRDDTLLFHRSWTGFCIYAARFRREGAGYRLVEADVNRDVSQYGQTDDAADKREILSLIDRLLLGNAPRYPAVGDPPGE